MLTLRIDDPAALEAVLDQHGILPGPREATRGNTLMLEIQSRRDTVQGITTGIEVTATVTALIPEIPMVIECEVQTERATAEVMRDPAGEHRRLLDLVERGTTERLQGYPVWRGRYRASGQ